MSIRQCLPADLPLEHVPWLVPDDDLQDGHCLVQEVDGRIAAAGLRRASRTQATQDGAEFFCEDGYGTDLIRELAGREERPIVLRVIPGTAAAAAVDQVRSQVLQSVPAAYFPTDHPEVHAWAKHQLEAARSSGINLKAGTDFTMDELLDMWMAPYPRMHESWAPTSDVEATREAFRGRFKQDLHLDRTVIASHEGRAVAATFTVGPFDGTYMPIMMELQLSHRMSEPSARASIAAMLTRTSPTPVEFDGHADEPVYMRILETIPQRSAGARTPMNLIQISTTN